jgi:DNA mismatch repair protein MutS
MAQHPLTQSLLLTLVSQGLDLSPHLKAAFEKLSDEHASGISLAQMETPMMRQFKEAKDAVPDALLFFRMGDFYELFGADAVIAAEVCQLTLTSRDRNSDNPVPMAGVPVVNHRSTLRKALAAGYKVAVCDQLEDPKLAKGLVKRDIVRIATPAVPGDLGDDDDSTSPSGTWLSCAVPTPAGVWALAFVDVSTGVFRYTGRLSLDEVQQELTTLNPREIVVPGASIERFTAFARTHFTLIPRVSPLPSWIQRSTSDTLRLFEDFFPLNKLNAFGLSGVDGALQAVTGVLNYLKETQRGVVRNLTSIDFYDVSKHLFLDDATKRHLDFFVTGTGERKGSLFHFLNQCATACGARLLAHKLNYPEKSRANIEPLHHSVDDLLKNSEAERLLFNELRPMADIDRLLGKAAQSSIDPKGLAWLGQTLASLPKLVSTIDGLPEASAGWTSLSADFSKHIQLLSPLEKHLTAALENEPAQVVGKGGRIFRTGYNAELDELCDLESNFEAKIAALESHERSVSGIPTLKIGYTRAFGYYFEISKGKLAQVPAHFERKQTLVNGERFVTPELKELEEKALSASDRRTAIERQLLETLRLDVIECAEPLSGVSRLIAHTDVLRCFAQLAKENRWCKPEWVESSVTALEQCVHPILSGLRTTQSRFVANDVVLGNTSSLTAGQYGYGLSSGQVLLVTGPNMAGKSTVMRQVALAHILAQMGCYVPARKATLGVCDKIFTRIGSGDFALRNQSTFMVEMLETAHMLRFATPNSLLLLDEIGRGTSTFDGLSLAWAILEHLSDNVRSRALFSTHYHELVDAVAERPQVRPMRMEVVEEPSAQGEKIIFTYRFLAGAAGKSYGIHVARLAGVPDGVIARASDILNTLSTQDRAQSQKQTKNEQTLIQDPTATAIDGAGVRDPLRTFLKELDPATISPREALDLLFELTDAAQTSPAPIGATALHPKRQIRRKKWDSDVLPSLFQES